jgi:phospholipase/carboxylesterase
MGRLTFIHSFDGSVTGDRSLLLLHGTGGNETSMLRLGRILAPDARLLAPRGKVMENGAARFFRRVAPNVLDEADVFSRTHELADFIVEACVHYQLKAPIVVGHSNGANMAISLLLLRSETIAGAILLRAAQITLSDYAPPDLNRKPVLLLSGARDRTILPERFAYLISSLRQYGASAEAEVVPHGHNISHDDILIGRRWLDANFPPG